MSNHMSNQKPIPDRILGYRAERYGNSNSIVVYPKRGDRAKFFDLKDYKVAASVSGLGLVLKSVN